MCLGDGAEDRVGFVDRLVGLGLRDGIADNAGACLDNGRAILDIGGTDDNAVIHGAITAQVADGAAEGAAASTFGVADELHCTKLRCAGQGSHVHAGAVGIEGVEILVQRGDDAGDQVHDARIAVHVEQLSDVAGAGNRDAREIVAGEVDEHDVFGHLLRVCAHLQFVADVQLMRGTARPGAGDGIELHLPVGGRVLEVDSGEAPKSSWSVPRM